MKRQSGQRAPRTAREIVQDVTLTVLSLAIVGAAAMAILTPPEKTIALGVDAEPFAGDTAIIYGSVIDTEDKPVRGAVVSVVYENGNGPEPVATTATDVDGSFHIESAGPFGTYRVIIAADAGRQTARDSISFEVEPGNAYGIRAELVDRDYFIFLPVVGY